MGERRRVERGRWLAQVSNRKGEQLSKIVNVEVTGLLDEYNHQVDIPEWWPFVLIYGPNGVGKTKLLESINYLSSGDLDSLSTIPFSSLTIQYDDFSYITVERSGQEELQLHLEEIEQVDPNLTITYRAGAEGEQRRFQYRPSSIRRNSRTLLAELDRLVPLLDDDSEEPWDEERESYARLWRIADRERNRLRPRDYRLLNSVRSQVKAPDDFRELAHSSPIYFIQTQRLLLEERKRDEDTSKWTISKFSEDLKSKLAQALTQNSRRTQQLDRSFPQRIFSESTARASESSIRKRYKKQSDNRNLLADYGLIKEEIDFPIPKQKLEDWHLHVLQIYLDDTDEKLGTFNSIVEHVTLFLDIVNRRLVGKFVKVNADYGLRVIRRSTGRVIKPSHLSSGEQHELVLMYDLIFNVPDNALVLIDEPEISLHIAWQMEFTNDLTRIAELRGLRFLIATHSPQIVNKSWSKTVELEAPRQEGSEYTL